MVNDLLKCRKIVFLYFHILYLHKNIFLPANVPYPQSPLPVVNTLLHNSSSDPYLSWYKLNLTLLSMSNRTRSHKLLLPNHWAQSQIFYKWQTTGHEISIVLSMPNHWARSQRLSMPNSGHEYDPNYFINARQLGTI